MELKLRPTKICCRYFSLFLPHPITSLSISAKVFRVAPDSHPLLKDFMEVFESPINTSPSLQKLSQECFQTNNYFHINQISVNSSNPSSFLSCRAAIRKYSHRHRLFQTFVEPSTNETEPTTCGVWSLFSLQPSGAAQSSMHVCSLASSLLVQ